MSGAISSITQMRRKIGYAKSSQRGRHVILGRWSANRKLSGNGLEEMNGDFPEADFGTTSRLAGRKPPIRSSVRLRITSA
jgi:hypothetical protein